MEVTKRNPQQQRLVFRDVLQFPASQKQTPSQEATGTKDQASATPSEDSSDIRTTLKDGEGLGLTALYIGVQREGEKKIENESRSSNVLQPGAACPARAAWQLCESIAKPETSLTIR